VRTKFDIQIFSFQGCIKIENIPSLTWVAAPAIFGVATK